MSPTKPPDNRHSAASREPRCLNVHDDTVTSDTLLGKTGQLVIEHNGRSYQLRRTRNDKLILTS